MSPSYFIAVDRQLPAGGTLVNAPISRRIRSKSAALRVLKRVRRTTPEAHYVRVGALV